MSSWSGKLNEPLEEKSQLRKDFPKLKQKWRSKIGKREILILLLLRLIKSSNPNDYSCNRRIDGLIRPKERSKNLRGELEMTNGLFRENRANDCQAIEELRRICCEETDRARQPRIDELSMPQKRGLTTASQLLTQIQDLQNKEKSLSNGE